MALANSNFDLTEFYTEEQKEYRFYLSRDTSIVIGEGQQHGIIQLQGRGIFQLELQELIQLAGYIPYLAVAVDSTNVKIAVQQGLAILEKTKHLTPYGTIPQPEPTQIPDLEEFDENLLAVTPKDSKLKLTFNAPKRK